MQTELILILLFTLQSTLNIAITIWGVRKITHLEELIRHNKNDLDAIGNLVRRNRTIIDSRLTRFICEVSSKFRNLNLNSDFTYPDSENDS